MRRPQIDPKTLRKHSRIVEKRQDPVVVAGPREQTDYGFFIDGHKSKSFETKFAQIMPSCMTPKWLHEKKTRVLRVIGGVGHYETYAEDDTVTTKPIVAGDEVVIEPGTTYRIKSSPAKLEFYIIQDAKYEASLKELAPAETIAQVSVDDLQSVTPEDKTHQQAVVLGTDRSLRRNRAREQMALQRGQNPGAGQPRLPGQRAPQSEDSFFRSSAAGGINEMPVGSFDPDGAG
jgi:hypothetical protein